LFSPWINHKYGLVREDYTCVLNPNRSAALLIPNRFTPVLVTWLKRLSCSIGTFLP
jgi:hypothetical protein